MFNGVMVTFIYPGDSSSSLGTGLATLNFLAVADLPEGWRLAKRLGADPPTTIAFGCVNSPQSPCTALIVAVPTLRYPTPNLYVDAYRYCICVEGEIANASGLSPGRYEPTKDEQMSGMDLFGQLSPIQWKIAEALGWLPSLAEANSPA